MEKVEVWLVPDGELVETVSYIDSDGATRVVYTSNVFNEFGGSLIGYFIYNSDFRKALKGVGWEKLS